jgi:predicted  nucleic acid-binding Zn-ribbon protein
MDSMILDKRRKELEQNKANLRFRLAQIDDQIENLQAQRERLNFESAQMDGAIAAFAEMQQAAVNGTAENAPG